MSRDESPTAAFPAPSHDDWRRAAEQALRGKPLESIVWRTEDGLELPPLVEAADVVDVTPARREVATCGRVFEGWETTEEVLHAFDHGFDVVRLDALGARPGVLERVPAECVLIDAGDWTDVAEWLSQASEGRLGGVVFGEAPSNLPPALQLAETLSRCLWLVGGRAAGRHDLPADDVARAVILPVTVGPEVVAEVAKLRALRALWPRVAERAGVSAAAARATRFLAVASDFHLTRFEPESNLLRSCLGAFAAICGGADIVELDAYDARAGGGSGCDGASLAIAQVRMMLGESHLAAVPDPFAGAPTVEALTARIVDLAWRHFEAFEAVGGAVEMDDDAHFEDGISMVDAMHRRFDEIVRRKRVIVGLNRFADPAGDDDVGGDPEDLWGMYGDADDDYADRRDALSVTASDPFDWLRDRVLGHVETGGRRPVALIVGAGEPRPTRAASAFAADLFRCGGFDVGAPDPGATPGDAAAALADRVFDALVVCGDDNVVAAVEAATDMPYYRVGRDGAASERVIARLFEGIDAVEVLADALDRIGVPRVPFASEFEELDDDDERLADIAGLGEWDA